MSQGGVTTKKTAPEFLLPEPLSQIAPELVRPRRWRSFLGFLSMLWLLFAVLGSRYGCSASRWPAGSGRSASWWLRPTGLTISALPSFSRTACFARRRTGGLTMLRSAMFVRTRACWRRRSAESLIFQSLAATLWRNVRRTRTFTELSLRWPAALYGGYGAALAVDLRRSCTAWFAVSLAPLRWW